MFVENLLFAMLSLYLVTFEIGEIAFFIVAVILAIAVIIKVIKNKKSKSDNL